MAITIRNPIDEHEIDELVSKLSMDLRYLLDAEKISLGIQAKLVKLGITDLNAFAKLEDTQSLMRDVIKEEIGIHPADGGGNRGMMARILSAWDSAVQRGVKRKAAEAESSALDMPRRLPKPDHIAILRAFNKLHGPPDLEEEEIPGPRWTESRLDQIESNAIKPEKLSEAVTWSEEDGSEALALTLGSNRTVQAIRAAPPKGQLPISPEQLRTVLKLMSRHWEFVRLKAPLAALLGDYSMDVWSDHADYILGKKVYAKEIKAEGGSIYRPSWQLTLEYEYEVRKQACWAVNVQCMTLKAAFAHTRSHEATTRYHSLHL